MRNKIASVLLIAATLGLGTAAMAQSVASQASSGVITSIDLTEKTVTLADGQTYYLPGGYDISSLADGQKVALGWDQVGGEKQVQSLRFEG